MQKKNEKKVSIHKDHRKRMKQKFLENGTDSFTEHEMLEFLLFFSKPQGDTNALAHTLLNTFGSINGVLNAPYDSLVEIDGVGEHTAIMLKFLPQIFKEYQATRSDKTQTLTTVGNCYELASKLFCNSVVEELYIVCLNAKNTVLSYKMIAAGNADRVEVNMRDITNFVLKNKSARILVYHNHPSEILEFSRNDISLTTTIFSSCILNEIDVLDHILYTHNGCISMHRLGIMSEIKQDVLNRLNIDNASKIYRKLFCASRAQQIDYSDDK